MVPSQSNYETARHTLDELLAVAPKAFGIKDFAEKLAICLMEDIVTEAMMSVHFIKLISVLILFVGYPNNLGYFVLVSILS
jgi:hypothetical protein